MILRLFSFLIVLSTPFVRAQVLYPTVLDFGNVVVGLPYSKTLTIVNTTDRTIFPMHYTCTGMGEVITEAPLPDSIEAGDSAVFVMKLRATSVSPLDYGCGIGHNLTLPGRSWSVGYDIRGTISAGARFTMSQTLLDFGEVEVGDTVSATITIVNSGSGMGTVDLFYFASDEFTCSLSTDPVELDPMDTLIVDVLYHPTQEGQMVDTLLFNMSDQWWNARTVALHGAGIPPKPGVSPSLSSVSFSSAPINQRSSATVELSITSGMATVTEIYAVHGEVFSITLPPVVMAKLPAVIQPGAPYSFEVVANPLTTGSWKDTIVVRTSEYADLRLPVEANAVLSHVDEVTTDCQPHPNPSHGSVTWCTSPYSTWVITDLRGTPVSSWTADSQGRCNASGLATGTYLIRSNTEPDTYMLVVIN